MKNVFEPILYGSNVISDSPKASFEELTNGFVTDYINAIYKRYIIPLNMIVLIFK